MPTDIETVKLLVRALTADRDDLRRTPEPD